MTAQTATALRRRYERTLGLNVALQMSEVIDYLGHPEVLIAEFVDAFCLIDSSISAELWVCKPPDPGVSDELTLEHFYADRRIRVLGEDPFEFVCVAGEIAPALPGRDAAKEPAAGLDYAGVVDGAGTPVLGAIQSERDRTGYQLLIRLLTCLAEVAPEAQWSRLNHNYFQGALAPQQKFDLHLVVWDSGGSLLPLYQLTRDLCDVFMRRIAEEAFFRPVLGSIVCLRMDPTADFDGELSFAWRVPA